MTEIIIFGASRFGKLAKEYLEISHTILAFCDNDSSKHSEYFEGIQIISPEKLLEIYYEKQILIIVASMYYKQISIQLSDLGINKGDINIFENRIRSYESKLTNKFDVNIDLDNYTIQSLNNKKKNVHLMPDNFYSNKFIKVVNRNFKKEENLFIIYDSDITFKYIEENYDNVLKLNIDNEYGDIYIKLLECNKLFLHYFDDSLAKFMYDYKIREIVDKIYWPLWGGDFYPYLELELFEPMTKELKGVLDITKQSIKRDKYKEYMVSQIDYILASSEGDYNLVKDRFELTATRKWFAYHINVDIEFLNKVKKIKLNNLRTELGVEKIIWLGNSATYENNHLEIMHSLSKIDNKKFAIVCPLSYGNDTYRRKIIEIGKEMFGSRFYPLLEFIEGEEYFKLLNNADILIMNHIRQQGFGNILGAIYLEKKIYMNSKSTLYDYFTKNDISIFDSNVINDINTVFSMDFDKKNNIKTIQKMLNDKIIEENIINILNE